jgi:organic hydroperoxide reductase OsmC/OhrA
MDFETVVEWKARYPGRLSSQNGSVVDYSPPVEFGGPHGPMSPEDALIGAANMCFQIVFAGIAGSLGVEIHHYSCRAVGRLETVDGVRKFTTIELFPEILVARGADKSKVERALEAAKSRCLVTNSMNVKVTVSARISE